MNSKYIIMNLIGPEQSWGDRSPNRFKKTLRFPTKSGVVGMLCASLGIEREDTDKILEVNNSISMDTYVFSEGHIEDQRNTLTNGYKNYTDRMNQNGTPNNTIIITKSVLIGAAFSVIITSDENHAELFMNALMDPIFDISLGRKQFSPSEEVFGGLCDSHQDAKNNMIETMSILGYNECKYSIHNATNISEMDFVLYDEIIGSREFAPRFVTISYDVA